LQLNGSLPINLCDEHLRSIGASYPDLRRLMLWWRLPTGDMSASTSEDGRALLDSDETAMTITVLTALWIMRPSLEGIVLGNIGRPSDLRTPRSNRDPPLPSLVRTAHRYMPYGLATHFEPASDTVPVRGSTIQELWDNKSGGSAGLDSM